MCKFSHYLGKDWENITRRSSESKATEMRINQEYLKGEEKLESQLGSQYIL
jgi:hypothetical protein